MGRDGRASCRWLASFSCSTSAARSALTPRRKVGWCSKRGRLIVCLGPGPLCEGPVRTASIPALAGLARFERVAPSWVAGSGARAWCMQCRHGPLGSLSSNIRRWLRWCDPFAFHERCTPLLCTCVIGAEPKGTLLATVAESGGIRELSCAQLFCSFDAVSGIPGVPPCSQSRQGVSTTTCHSRKRS